MGVIINDSITLDSSIELTGMYAGIGNVFVQKIDDTTYSVESTFKLWKDKSSRDDGSAILQAVPISLTMEMSGLSTLFPQLFAQFKLGYESTTDSF